MVLISKRPGFKILLKESFKPENSLNLGLEIISRKGKHSSVTELQKLAARGKRVRDSDLTYTSADNNPYFWDRNLNRKNYYKT